MPSTTTEATRSLRNLYFVRTLFQLVWAAAVFSTMLTQPTVAAALLILYPLWDVACTIYDLASSTAGSAKSSQIVNAGLGLAASIAIAVTIFHQPRYAIAAFGAWALGAGLLQLTGGLLRRKQFGGQWAMILSGAQSSAAGISFILGGLADKVHLKNVGGYAIFGAFYFLIGGHLLVRKLSQMKQPAEA